MDNSPLIFEFQEPTSKTSAHQNQEPRSLGGFPQRRILNVDPVVL